MSCCWASSSSSSPSSSASSSPIAVLRSLLRRRRSAGPKEADRSRLKKGVSEAASKPRSGVIDKPEYLEFPDFAAVKSLSVKSLLAVGFVLPCLDCLSEERQPHSRQPGSSLSLPLSTLSLSPLPLRTTTAPLASASGGGLGTPRSFTSWLPMRVIAGRVVSSSSRPPDFTRSNFGLDSMTLLVPRGALAGVGYVRVPWLDNRLCLRSNARFVWESFRFLSGPPFLFCCCW